ncbi:hypothetical protein AB0J47_17335 [Nocardia sp. NPDC049737]|uniref:hypothetical protein n=1 Tax=Nocardia sp. NPDC049737 TaxID=3154358 RepID=UPI003442132C
MQREIIEHEDRWIILPLRQSRIVATEWHSNQVDLILDTGFKVVVGYDAELSLRTSKEESPGRHELTHWSSEEAERILESEILSPVFFKSGGARIALRNGWLLLLADRPATSPAAVYSQSSLLWTRDGLSSQTEYPVLRIDPWTGQLVTTLEWPPRPSDLAINYESDDINE